MASTIKIKFSSSIYLFDDYDELSAFFDWGGQVSVVKNTKIGKLNVVENENKTVRMKDSLVSLNLVFFFAILLD